MDIFWPQVSPAKSVRNVQLLIEELQIKPDPIVLFLTYKTMLFFASPKALVYHDAERTELEYQIQGIIRSETEKNSTFVPEMNTTFLALSAFLAIYSDWVYVDLCKIFTESPVRKDTQCMYYPKYCSVPTDLT